MFSKNIIENFIKIGIISLLKSVCKSIDIQSLKLILNNKYFGKVDEIYLEGRNIIYKGLYINNIKIKIYDCNLKFNYRNHLIYSEDIIINSFLTIDKRGLENTFFSSICKNLRIKFEKNLIEGGNVSNFFLVNDLITCSYSKSNLNKQIILLLDLKENLIFLEDINNKNKFFIPLDKNIKFNCCNIKNELINIDLSTKVIFEN